MLLNPSRFWDPITKDWLARGAVASDTTIAALNVFFTALRAESGLISKFLRMNLFCGNDRASALIPQIVESGGGNETVAGGTEAGLGYTETGASGGIGWDGVRYLETGFLPSADLSDSRDAHLAFYVTDPPPTGGTWYYGGSFDAGTNPRMSLNWETTPRHRAFIGDAVEYAILDTAATTPRDGFLIINNRASNDGEFYQNTTSRGTDTSFTSNARPTYTIWIGALNNAGSVAGRCPSGSSFGGYSIGLGLTSSQRDAYQAAMETFQDALTRGVA